MTELAEVRGLCEATLKAVADLKASLAPRRAPLTIVAFAKAVGLSRWTIQKRIRDRAIHTVAGRIPASELDKFLS